MTRSFGQFKFVRHHEVYDYMERGWMIVDDLQDTTHGYYSVRMWRCDCLRGQN